MKRIIKTFGIIGVLLGCYFSAMAQGSLHNNIPSNHVDSIYLYKIDIEHTFRCAQVVRASFNEHIAYRARITSRETIDSVVHELNELHVDSVMPYNSRHLQLKSTLFNGRTILWQYDEPNETYAQLILFMGEEYEVVWVCKYKRPLVFVGWYECSATETFMRFVNTYPCEEVQNINSRPSHLPQD